MNEQNLIYDWNTIDTTGTVEQPVEIDDETLRDGLQSPSVTQPTIEQKIEILHVIADLGIQGADIGLPGARGKVLDHVIALAREIVDHKLPIEPNCAARTLEADIAPIALRRAALIIEERDKARARGPACAEI